GNGYLPATYAPFKINPAASGIPNTTNPNDPLGSSGRFNAMYSGMRTLDDALRSNSPYGKPLDDYDSFYQQAKTMMYDPTVQKAFQFTSADSQRYGGTGFGNACLVAKQALAANQGTKFVLISFGSWDMH